MKEGRSKERKNEATKDRLKGKRTNNKQGQKNKKIGFQNHENIIKIEPGGTQIEKNGGRGYPQEAKKNKDEKKCGPL